MSNSRVFNAYTADSWQDIGDTWMNPSTLGQQFDILGQTTCSRGGSIVDVCDLCKSDEVQLSPDSVISVAYNCEGCRVEPEAKQATLEISDANSNKTEKYSNFFDWYLDKKKRKNNSSVPQQSNDYDSTSAETNQSVGYEGDSTETTQEAYCPPRRPRVPYSSDRSQVVNDVMNGDGSRLSLRKALGLVQDNQESYCKARRPRVPYSSDRSQVVNDVMNGDGSRLSLRKALGLEASKESSAVRVSDNDTVVTGRNNVATQQESTVKESCGCAQKFGLINNKENFKRFCSGRMSSIEYAINIAIVIIFIALSVMAFQLIFSLAARNSTCHCYDDYKRGLRRQATFGNKPIKFPPTPVVVEKPTEKPAEKSLNGGNALENKLSFENFNSTYSEPVANNFATTLTGSIF